MARVTEVHARRAPTVAAPAQAAHEPTLRRLLGNVRVVPEQAGQDIIGLRVFGIQPGSVLALLGLHNGDRLEAIDDHALTSPQNALLAYSHLRDASDLELRIARAGETIRLTYHVR